MPIKVIFAETFYVALKKLHKRFPHILDDVDPLVVELRGGETPGDRIPGISYRVYKVRLRNTDAQRGKSGGYRVIYYLETQEQTVILTIYSKTDQSDLPLDVIIGIIEDYQQ
jgi:Cytotoxic translational repressor of toxin-antitoxin stability system